MQLRKHIELLKPLPQNTVRQMIVGGMQSTFGRKPQIKGVPDNIDYYDEIILGTPIWAGMPAAPVYTFIKKYGIADKIDAVFTFSGGGDNDRCMAQLSKTLKNIKNEVALADRNSEMAKNNHDKLEKFIMDINKIKEYKLPPELNETKICKKCAYFDMCFI